jgi:hypothetical protein
MKTARHLPSAAIHIGKAAGILKVGSDAYTALNAIDHWWGELILGMDNSQFAWVWSSSGRGEREARARFAFQPSGLGFIVISTGVITTILKLSAGFQSSSARGDHLLNSLWIVVVVGSALMLLIFVQAWISPSIRAIKLAKLPRLRGQFIARLVPGFWEALRKIDPGISSKARGTNTNAVIDDTTLSFWLGRGKPEIVAKFNLSDVVNVALEYGRYKAITFRLMVVSVKTEDSVIEVPISVAPIWSIGILPPSLRTRNRIAELLRSSPASVHR